MYLCAAFPAEGTQLGLVAGQCEAGLRNLVCKLLIQRRIADFSDDTTICADNQYVVRSAACIMAGYPGVRGIQAVCQALFNKEV